MKIAIDFDGVILHEANTLNHGFTNQLFQLVDKHDFKHELFVVTERPSSDREFVEGTLKSTYLNITKIEYLSSVKAKIQFLSSPVGYDVLIDNDREVLQNADAPIKLLAGYVTEDQAKDNFEDDIMYCKNFKEVMNLLDAKLYSPGPVPGGYRGSIEYSPSSPQFDKMMKSCIDQLASLLDYKYEPSIIQGNALDAVLQNLPLAPNNEIAMHHYGPSGREAASFLREHQGTHSIRSYAEDELEVLLHDVEMREDLKMVFAVQYEVGISTYNKDLIKIAELCRKKGKTLIVDALQSIIYYPPPDADVIITTSSNQLRGLPSLGIVYQKAGLKFGLGKHASEPHSALIPQIQSLLVALEEKRWVPHTKALPLNASRVIKGLEDRVVGDPISPVATFMCEDVYGVRASFQKFGINVDTTSHTSVQISCFNYSDINYYKYVSAVLKLSDRKL